MIPLACQGEFCNQCRAQAMHKVEEDLSIEEGYTPPTGPQRMSGPHIRHPLVAYLCDACFYKLMQPWRKVSDPGADDR